MELDEAIRNRRSIRKYKPDQVPDDLIKQIIEAGSWAPSGKNRQLVEYIVVKDESSRKKLSELFPHGPFLAQAPVTIIVLSERKKTRWFIKWSARKPTPFMGGMKADPKSLHTSQGYCGLKTAEELRLPPYVYRQATLCQHLYTQHFYPFP